MYIKCKMYHYILFPPNTDNSKQYDVTETRLLTQIPNSWIKTEHPKRSEAIFLLTRVPITQASAVKVPRAECKAAKPTQNMQAVQPIAFFDRRAQRAAGKEDIFQCLCRETRGLIALRRAPLSDRSSAAIDPERRCTMPTVAQHRRGVAEQ